MNKKLLIIGLVVIILGIGMKIFVGMMVENTKKQNEVYRLLEQDEMTDEEKWLVDFITNPDEMKESYVSLDLKHREMFKKHFGRER